MKLIWLTAKDLIGKYNLPNTVQGLAKKARNENWEKRRVKGQKGGGFEYEVSNIINKFELLQNYEKGLNNKPQTQSSNHNEDEDEKKTNGIPVNDDFFKNYIMVGDLGIETTNSNDLKITTNGIARIILSKDFVEQQGLLNAKLATFTVTDDSMADTIKNGDTLMVSVCDETEQQKAVDGIYVILFNGVLMVKRLQYNPVKVSYNVISDNLDYQPFTVTPKEEPTFKVIAKLERVLSKK